MVGQIQSAVEPFKPNVAIVTTPDASVTAWTIAAHRMFTITGMVKIINFFGDVSETLIENNGDETIEIGIAGNTALLIAQLATPLSLVAGDIWSKATHTPGGILNADPLAIADTDIDLVVAGTAGINDGTIDFYVEWIPMSDGALLVPAVWD